MSQTRIARRYAEALMLSAEDLHQTEVVGRDLVRLRDLIRESRDFQLFLRSPVIKTEKKQEVLQTVFGSKLHALTNQVLQLLAEKGREDVLPALVEEFFRFQDERHGIVRMALRAAVELTDDQTARIRERFESLTRKKVEIEFSVDRALQGGFVARVGDTVFDGSVRHQLEVLRRRFTETPQN